MGKTETIKRRAIYVYLPSIEMVEHWKELARRQGTSISKFVMGHVENSLRQDDEGYRSRSSLVEENRELLERLEEKEKQVRHLEMLLEKLEEDLRLYRAQPFLDDDFTGIRTYDRRLVEILREPGVHSHDEILSRLGIKTMEHEAIKAVSKELERLQNYGLVKATPRGWKWTQQ